MKVLRPLCAAIAVVAAASTHAAAAATTPDALAVQSASAFVVPHMHVLALAAAAQARVWDDACGRRSPSALPALQRAFNTTADAWAQIDFVRMGPATVEMRTERFNYWLDRGNAAGKALNALVAAPDEGGLTPAAMKGASAAAQGQPLLERLLFDDGAAAKLFAAGPDGERRCAIGRAVAHNVSDIAQALAADWDGPEGAAAAMAADKAWGVHFANRKEAASVLLTDIVIGLEGLKDNETAMVFHDEANPVAVRLAQGWRSERQVRDLHLTYAAVREALSPYLAGAQGADAARTEAAFTAVDAGYKSLDQAVAATPAHSAERKAALQALMQQMGVLVEAVMTVAPKASGIALGFNSLDGD